MLSVTTLSSVDTLSSCTWEGMVLAAGSDRYNPQTRPAPAEAAASVSAGCIFPQPVSTGACSCRRVSPGGGAVAAHPYHSPATGGVLKGERETGGGG